MPWLKGTPDEKFAQLEKHLRGLDVAMAEVGYRYGELLIAAKERNWDYAQYQTEKIEHSLRLAIERRPKRAKSAELFLKGDLPPVTTALKNKDGRKLDAAVTQLHNGCVQCHKNENVLYFKESVDRIRMRSLAPTALPLKAGEKNVNGAIEVPGVVEAAEEARLFTRIPGFIQKVHVSLGDRVKKGQILAELSVPEIEAELKQKSAVVTQVDAEVDLARRTLHFAEAAIVLATAQVEEGEAAVKRAQANHERYKSEYERLRKLLESKAIDKQVLDEGVHKLESAKAGAAEAEAKAKAAKAARDGSLAKRDMMVAEVNVTTARRDVAKADLQRVEAVLQFAKVHAPFDGVIAMQSIHPGALVRTTDAKPEPLFVVIRVDRVRIAIKIPEAMVSTVKVGTPVLIRVPALKAFESEGKVGRVAVALDPQTRTLRAEIDLPNADGRLLPGMHAVVTFKGPEPMGGNKNETHKQFTSADQLRSVEGA